MKKLISLLLCLLMVFGMVACSEETAQVEETVQTEEKPYAGQELNVWTAYVDATPTAEAANEYIAKFEEKTGAKINVTHYGRDLPQILPAALTAGEEVDVFCFGSTLDLNSYFEYTMDLTDYINNSDYLDRAYPVQMDQIRLVSENDDEWHAIPTLSSVGAYWYNKALFEQAGVENVPANPTIEEFEAICDQLVEAGLYPMALDSAYAGPTFGIFCGRMVGEEAAKDMVFNGGFAENERFVALCQKIIDWKAKGYFEPNAPAEFPASQNRMGLIGDVAMVGCGMWVSGEVESMTGTQMEWGAFNYPYDPTCEDGTTGGSISCTCNCINANIDPEKADLAWEYMYYMSTGEADKAITDADNYVVNDRTQEPLPRFVGVKDILSTITEQVDYAGGLHSNADIKVSIDEVIVRLYAGEFETGEEAAAAFDALLD